MIVKICGITTDQAAKSAVDAGADFIGFVFADSKRKVTKDEARILVRKIPNHVNKVGVFVDENPAIVQEIAEEVGLDYVQLHGDESPEYCQQITFPVIKAFQIKSKEDLEKLANYHCDYYLLDSPAGKYRGGNGEVFDWKLVKDLPDYKGKVILAGGLHAGNVQQAIREVEPMGVDVSSGVETNGVKDLDKIAAFVHEAKLK